VKHKGSHKLTKVTLGRKNDYVLYKCTLKGCTHTIPPQLLIGRETLCNECDLPLTIESSKDLIIKPKCRSCRSRGEVDMDEVEKVIERLS
jgi:hypothetical protein